MSVEQETGNARRRVSDAVTAGETPESYPSPGGHLVDPDEAAPIGDELAVSELGVAAQSARVNMDAGLERLTREPAEPWPVWDEGPDDVVLPDENG